MRDEWAPIAGRPVRFLAVSGAGVVVQLAVVAAIDAVGVHYLIATTAGVTAAVAHNFFWHSRWTWADRRPAMPNIPLTFGRFVAANGAVSLAGNVLAMSALVGIAGVSVVSGNALAIGVCGIVNYVLADKVVFARGPGLQCGKLPGHV